MLNLQIQRMVFVKSGTHNQMLAMNLTSHVNMDTVNLLDQQTHGGVNLETSNLSGIAGNLLRTDMNSGVQLQIPNGFNSERLRVFVHVTGAGQMGSGFNYYYSGYTDSVGIDNNGNFNPQMRIFLNSCIMVASTMRMTPNGLVPAYSVNDVSHLLNPKTMGANYNTQFGQGLEMQSPPSTLRPLDVFSNRASSESARQTGTPVINFTNTVTSKSMNRMNYIPQNYLSKALKAIRTAKSETQFDSSVDKYHEMTGYVAEKQITADGFISGLNQMNYLTNGWVAFGDLVTVHQELRDGSRIKYANTGSMSQNSQSYVSRAGEHENFVNQNGAMNRTNEAMIAQTLASTMPGVLLTNLMRRCRLVVTNMSPMEPGLVVKCDSPAPLAEMPAELVANRVPIIEQILRNAVFNDLPINLACPLMMTLVIDLFGTTYISISYNGQPEVSFSIPSFSDSMFTPLVAQNKSPLDQLTNDFSYLEEAIQL